jgi:hypothetical protein
MSRLTPRPQTNGKSSVLKIVGLFKRKPGISREAFREYYETKHVKLFEQHVALPGVLRFSRRYLTQIDGMSSPLPTTTGGYDVIMEVWYKDRELFESLRSKPNPEFTKIAIEDEEQFIDRGSMTMYFSDDVETKSGPWEV